MKRLIASAALLASIGSAHAVNLVVNGGFESVTQRPGTWGVYKAIDGWTTASGSGIEIRDRVRGSAFEGSNFAELDSHRNSTMQQTLATVAGQSYTLSFEYAARPGVASSSNPISVWWDDLLLGTAVASGIGHKDNVWTTYAFTVLGTGSDVLRFGAVGKSDSYGGSLDAVAVSPVPEPATVAMLAGGLALVAVAARRRGARG